MEQSMEKQLAGRLPAHLDSKNLAFPFPAPEWTMVQTHISIVFLAGEFAYKIKKPVKFPFVDYSTLEKRRAFCDQEVRLNRRLAPDVYLGVVPVSRRNGSLVVEGEGPAVEYAVKMRRLPDEKRLNRFLGSGALPGDFWPRLVERLIHFYGEAAQGPEICRWAEPKAVEEDWNQILAQIRDFQPGILTSDLRDQLEKSFREQWGRHSVGIRKRVEKARDGHGDLRMEHIYYFPAEKPPKDILIIDCVEFDSRYRCCDPLSDIAFLAMDLEAAGFPEEARLFEREYLKTSGEGDEGLMDFYIAYRHLVRGLVRGLQAREEDTTSGEKTRALSKARIHFLQALGKLAEPPLRPCLILIGGLPGVGKSTLSEQLAKGYGFQVLSSDAVRKELAGHPVESQPATGYEKGIYKPEWTEKTYSTLLERAEAALLQGHRVLVDASFSRQAWRSRFEDLARHSGAPLLFFICMTSHETAHRRLSEARHFGSDADYGIYQKMAERWETPSPSLGALFLNTERAQAVNLGEIRKTLEQHGLASPELSGSAAKN